MDLPASGRICVQLLNRRECDAIWCGVAITPERQQLLEFTRPYAVFNESVVVRPDSKVASPADLAGLKVLAIDGSTNIALANSFERCTGDSVRRRHRRRPRGHARRVAGGRGRRGGRRRRLFHQAGPDAPRGITVPRRMPGVGRAAKASASWWECSTKRSVRSTFVRSGTRGCRRSPTESSERERARSGSSIPRPAAMTRPEPTPLAIEGHSTAYGDEGFSQYLRRAILGRRGL